MPRKCKGSKPTKGQNNSENNFHIGSPSVSRKPNPIQTHHVGSIYWKIVIDGKSIGYKGASVQKNRGSIGQGAETSKRGDMLENFLFGFLFGFLGLVYDLEQRNMV